MEQYEFICPCHFGLESVLKQEITALGYKIVSVEDGKVTFSGDVTAFARANVFLRTTERVLWKIHLMYQFQLKPHLSKLLHGLEMMLHSPQTSLLCNAASCALQSLFS